MASLQCKRNRVLLLTPEGTPSRPGTEPDSSSTPWPIARRRHTPYTKTPKSRKIHGQKSRLTRTPDCKSTQEEVGKLVNKTWNAFHVTPLFKFSRQPAALRRYARHLSSHLQAEFQKGFGVMVEEGLSSKYAVFTPISDLFQESEMPAVELCIHGSKTQATSTTNQPALTAILCPSSLTSDNTEESHFTNMPLLLVKGASSMTQCVLRWFEVQFDCTIQKMTFNPMALSWMVAMWAGSLPDKKKSGEDKKYGVELVYHFPKDVTGLKKVTMTIDRSDAKALWESVHDEKSDDAKEEEVSAFIRALEEHFHSCFKIHLSALHLETIGTAAAYVGAQGKVKMLSKREAKGVMQHLIELAEEMNLEPS